MNCRNCGAPLGPGTACSYCRTTHNASAPAPVPDPASEAPLQTLHGKNQTPPIKLPPSTGTIQA